MSRMPGAGSWAHLEEGDGGTIADAEQEEDDEDGEGDPQLFQLPVWHLCTALSVYQLCIGRGWSVPGSESLLLANHCSCPSRWSKCDLTWGFCLSLF